MRIFKKKNSHPGEPSVKSTPKSTPKNTHQVVLRGRNFLSSRLLHLPTELILKIFGHTADWGPGSSSLVLTAICYKLREIALAFPQLWDVVNFTTPSLAEMFLKRCNYEPRLFYITESQIIPEGRSSRSVADDPRWRAVWKKLEGRTFNDLRSFVYEGVPNTFVDMVVGVLRRAPNIATIDLRYRSPPHQELPWSLDNPLPNLSTLRLRGFWISWTSPLLSRNLRHLTLDFGIVRHLPEDTTIETFLTTLDNCSDIEILDLAFAGPDLLTEHQDNCARVVQLRKLRELSLMFHGPSRIQQILSHIEYPESTAVKLEASIDTETELPEAIANLFTPRIIETFQRRKANTLTVRLDGVHTFFTDNLFVRIFSHGSVRPRHTPQALSHFASKITDVVGSNNITSLSVQSWYASFPEPIWDVFLPGFPRLERIRYDLEMGMGDERVADPFIMIFSQHFEGGLVCPQLQHLELPQRVISQGPSAIVLKRVLAERSALGKRLKRLGLSSDVRERDVTALEAFRDLVEEIVGDP